MHRFFIEKENMIEDYLVIVGDDVKHIRNVLRLSVDDRILLCDGEGKDYLVKIESINKNDVRCRVIEVCKSRGEPPIEVVLYQGLPKSSKMDIIIQKAVELGVTKIQPIITERTIVKIKDQGKEQKKIERWQKIAEEASKQSGRGIIPAISHIVTFQEMVDSFSPEDFILVPYENEDKVTLKNILKGCQSKKINIVIGPEGGFESHEIETLQKINARIATLGARILRTETAGFTTIAIVMYELGDLGVI